MLRSQSSNDTFPTASHIAIIHSVDVLLKVITNLGFSLKKKGKEFINIPKSGRTHLMDAMPVTLGAEFIAYGCAIIRAGSRIHEKTAEIAEEAMENKISIKNIVLKRRILSAEEADKLFDLKIISQNHFNDKLDDI